MSGFYFFPNDHLSDVGLRRCSLEAQGLWWNMVCYMAQGQPFGVLRSSLSLKDLAYSVLGPPTVLPTAVPHGGPPRRTPTAVPPADPHGPYTVSRDGDRDGDLEPDLHIIVGKTPAEVKRLIGELESKNVFSRSTEGFIYCRRMVRDRIKRELGKYRAKKQKRGDGGQFTKTKGQLDHSETGYGVNDSRTPPPSPRRTPTAAPTAVPTLPNLPLSTEPHPQPPPRRGRGLEPAAQLTDRIRERQAKGGRK